MKIEMERAIRLEDDILSEIQKLKNDDIVKLAKIMNIVFGTEIDISKTDNLTHV